MRRKLITGLLFISMIIGLTGCGNSMQSIGYNGYDSVAQSYSNDAGVYANSKGYSGNMDYTGTDISGTLVDYSYDVCAGGFVDDKETALAFYENMQIFVDEHDGYIDNVNNTFYTNDLVDDDYFYYGDNFIKNEAEGCVSFNVQIEEQYAEDVINLFDDFCREHDFAVTRFNQYAANYESYDVVDEYNEDWYHGDDITQEDLDKQLAYTSIDISLDYSIRRNAGEMFELKVRSLLHEFIDSCGAIISALIWIIVFSFTGMFIIVLPLIKIFKKSMYKYNKKHPEYNIVKRVAIESDAKSDISSEEK